ncbi:MAG: hypothetical protein DI598_17825, partial [Pseudopedobacter saltans]
MALQELKVNKLRTFLSLFGITIGIFCIIGVLATFDSLKLYVKNKINEIGTNTIYIDKWEYLNQSDYPWWKFVNRPSVKYGELKLLQERTTLAEHISFLANQTVNLHYRNFSYSNITVNGVSDEYDKIQNFDVQYGRYINASEFVHGSAVGVIGFEIATQLFGSPNAALGKQLAISSKKITVIGVTAKSGGGMIDFGADNAITIPYFCFAGIFNTNNANNSPVLIVLAKPNISNTALIDELRGAMRQIRRLSPRQEDNFALNDINIMSKSFDGMFASLNIGGALIAGLSLLVGGFGVANIMFVTVRERTSQIGLKKAIGANKGTILTEFLLESAFLCVLGGLLGLVFVYVLTLIFNTFMPFPIVISASI